MRRTFSNLQASSLEELKMKYVEMIIECSDTYPITAADTLQLKTNIMPDNESIRCLFACVYKKAGMVRILYIYLLTLSYNSDNMSQDNFDFVHTATIK